ncbi:DUF6474 family protein [Gordonia sp. CPCC 205515]|uniref:DUF6474 family protein n=1 Tax=Gordonia sp. CPCC 205515 TaxID=3140791 RepID=UPI003AF3FD58
MGLFSSDGMTRAQRKAEAKALKAKAKMEAKLDHKSRRKTEKARRKDERKLRKQDHKQQRKTTKAEAKAQEKVNKAEAKTVAAKAKAAADAKTLSPANVRRYLTVGRLVAPIVIPIAYRAAVGARGQVTALQANRAGVSPDVLRQFSGHGATLSARITTARGALEKVAARDSSPEAQTFVATMNTRLDNLAIAVDAAETMPPAQRRTAHQSIDAELGAIDADVLARLGVQA